MSKEGSGLRAKLRAFLNVVREELASDFELVLQHRYLIMALGATVVGLTLFSNPPPPSRLVIASGPPGSAYSAFAREYKKFFAARGVEVDIRQTQGAVENARLVTDEYSDVQVAFIQAGLVETSQAAGIRSLGSLNYEPLWLFFRGSDNGGKLQKFVELGDRRVAIGAPESGSYAAAMQLLELNKQRVSKNLVVMPAPEAVAAINRNELDAVLIVDAAESENIRALVANPQLQLANFARAPAYARAVNHWQALVVPMGGLDLSRNFPPQETRIIATTTDLVVKQSAHPAIQMLLLQAAEAINGKPSFFEKRGEFPSFRNDAITQSEEARIFYKSGAPFLMRYMPFWLAEFFTRMAFYLLPMFLLSYPTIRLILDYRVQQGRIKINAVYRKLGELEKRLADAPERFDRETALRKLDDVERASMALRLPIQLSDEYFRLRANIDYVRTCLQRGAPYAAIPTRGAAPKPGDRRAAPAAASAGFEKDAGHAIAPSDLYSGE